MMMKELNLNQMQAAKGGTINGDWKDCASVVISFVGMFTGPWGAVLGLAGLASSAGGCERYLQGHQMM